MADEQAPEGFDRTDPMGNARRAVQRYGLDPALLDALEAAEREGDRGAAFDKALVDVLVATLDARGDLG